MYTDFASVYDRLMADVPYREWAAYYAELLEQGGVAGGSVAECACGTGSLTVELARRYPKITGIDQSGEMLARAMEKARGRGLLLPFIRQDMRRLSLPRKADAILCTCDGVNYLTGAADVTAFFRAARANLKPGGLLVFDVSTPYKLERELGSCVRALTDEDVAYIWQSGFDAEKSLLDIRMDIFSRTPSGDYHRIAEEQTQRAHSRPELTEWLTACGFEEIRFFGDRTMTEPDEKEIRWHVRARTGRS